MQYVSCKPIVVSHNLYAVSLCISSSVFCLSFTIVLHETTNRILKSIIFHVFPEVQSYRAMFYDLFHCLLFSTLLLLFVHQKSFLKLPYVVIFFYTYRQWSKTMLYRVFPEVQSYRAKLYDLFHSYIMH